MKGGDQRGFTLMEVLAAMAILSLVLAALTVVFRGQMGAWEKMVAKSDVLRREEYVYARLSRDLHNAIPPEADGTEWTGDGTGVFLVTGTGQYGLARVSYTLEQGKLIRREESLPPGLTPAGDPLAPQEEVLLAGLSRIAFSYWDGRLRFWKSSWETDFTSGLPAAVKVEFPAESGIPPFLIRVYVTGGEDEEHGW